MTYDDRISYWMSDIQKLIDGRIDYMACNDPAWAAFARDAGLDEHPHPQGWAFTRKEVE